LRRSSWIATLLICLVTYAGIELQRTWSLYPDICRVNVTVWKVRARNCFDIIVALKDSNNFLDSFVLIVSSRSGTDEQHESIFISILHSLLCPAAYRSWNDLRIGLSFSQKSLEIWKHPEMRA
jgi:hypothetical protein